MNGYKYQRKVTLSIVVDRLLIELQLSLYLFPRGPWGERYFILRRVDGRECGPWNAVYWLDNSGQVT